MNNNKNQTDLEGILTPKIWPYWPFLPMVKRGPLALGERWHQRVGVLTISGPGYLFASGISIYSRLEDAQFAPCLLEQLLADGWEVD